MSTPSSAESPDADATSAGAAEPEPDQETVDQQPAQRTPGRAPERTAAENLEQAAQDTDPSTARPTGRSVVRPEELRPDAVAVAEDAATRASTVADRGPLGVTSPARRWSVPLGLEIATGLAWRVLLIGMAAAAVLYVLGLLAAVVVPVILALIVASLLGPEAHLLSRVRWMPHALATVIVIVGGLGIVVGVFYGVVTAFLSGLPELSSQLTRSVTEIQDWLRTGPLGLDNQQFTNLGNEILSTLQQSQTTLAQGALGAVSTLGEIVTELLLTLFTLIFFVYDGGAVWRFLLRAAPRTARQRTDIAGRRAFASLVGYTRATILVAASDAITAGVGLWLIGVPLPVPLAALIFFGAFVPTLGAVVSGGVAVLVALVSGGLPDALFVILLLVLVQNLEGYILQPLLLGRSIKLHPLAVVLPIACGLVVAGIAGALLAVPLVTMIDSGIRSLTRPADGAGTDPESVDPLDPRSARPDWYGDDPPPRAWGARIAQAFRSRRSGRPT